MIGDQENLIPTSVDIIVDQALTVITNERLTPTINIVTLHAPRIASLFRAGQFMEIKVDASLFPLLRRPFSIHRVIGEHIQVMNKVVGVGTHLLYNVQVGMSLQTLAPLGNSFGYDKKDFELAILVSGGIGVAPMAMLEAELRLRGKSVINIVGARTAEDIISTHLSNVEVATDDGSLGFKGNVIECLDKFLNTNNLSTSPNKSSQEASQRIRIFACGPNPMLASLSRYSIDNGLPCEVSIESTMGCGIGICYGCPIRIKNKSGNIEQKLLCQYGSVVDSREIVFDE